MIDVGGQRSSRKRWIHCFDGVWAVIFVAALSDYHLTMEESPEINRLEESLNVFKSIVRCPELARAAMLLFLNKTDLFETAIEKHRIPFSKYFPQYDGPEGQVEPAKEGILREFQKIYNERQEERNDALYYHFTCATDTNNIKAVFCVTSDSIIKSSLTGLGIY